MTGSSASTLQRPKRRECRYAGGSQDGGVIRESLTLSLHRSRSRGCGFVDGPGIRRPSEVRAPPLPASGGPDRTVDCPDLHAQWLSSRAGESWRLPTNEEWA